MTEEKHIGGYQAERILEAWLHANGYPEVDRRKGATGIVVIEKADGSDQIYSQKRDIFGCIDLIAMNESSVWFIQVTTKAGVSHRRKKIALRKWPESLVYSGHVRVSIFTHSMSPSLEDQRKYTHFWCVEDYQTVGNGNWSWNKIGLFQFDIHDLKVEKKEVTPEDKAEADRIVRLPPEERVAAMKALKKERKKAKNA